jgi:hypothetical protein
LLSRRLIEAGNACLRQEEPVLISEHDCLAGWAVLVLFEFEFAKIALRLLAVACLNALEVLAEPEYAVPSGRT